jgi:hypothetical protein
MSLRKNTRLIGQHAFLSPSNYHWLDYDEEKLRRVYFQKQQAARGDKLHTFAQQAIELGVRQADNGTTLSTYINHAIGFRMTPEVPLYYSDDCFGTADACGFREEKHTGFTLRISDLKTGISPADMKQLKIYAALFCFEYEFSPNKLHIILRIYQNDIIEELIADPADIIMVMSRIKTQAALVAYLREED